MRVESNGRTTPLWIGASRLWLIGASIGLVIAGIAVSRFYSRPTLAVVAAIVLIMWPFSYARLWLLRHLDRAAPVPGWLGMVLGAIAAAFDAVMIAQLVTARSTYDTSWLGHDSASWIGPVWFSSHAMIFLVLCLAKPLRRIAAWTGGRLRTSHAVSLERREFLRNAGQLGVGLPFVVSLSGVETSYDFQVEEREIVLANWPRRLDGLRVAHLSDIHVGGAMDLAKLRRVAELTNAANVDLVLHTGDFLTHRLPGFDEPLYEALATVRPPFGQWACFGNHDFDDPARLTRRLSECGVEVLRNRLATVEVRGETIEIGGLDFAYYGLDRAERYGAAIGRWGERSGAPRVLLVHDPSAFATLPPGCADLVLSGHTHGGHVGVQLGGDTAVTVVGLLGIPDQGVFRRRELDDMQMYVTRCVGFYGYPIRLGIPPEIAVLTLRSASTSV